ncbi:MAG: cobalamin biosynthesis protein CbiM [Desulfuromonas sp.]|nr:MAG: cobalamin biosynthesis protein CbiM [Desulfuromonas sp.]
MHMADALLSPAVGGTLWAASAATIAWCARSLRRELADLKIPLMGVLGAFVFAAQMINFTIPGTGSSGHLGGGLLLTILLGPCAGFITLASILTVQALFFADGGLLALGCNIFNLGVFTCFVAYPLIFRPLLGDQPSRLRLGVAAMVSAVVGLQFGAFGVVLETTLSGVSELPLSSFALLMQPIHLAIGLVEGLVTAAVVLYLKQISPEVLDAQPRDLKLGKVLPVLLLAALMLGGGVSYYASEHPDGLEWSISAVTGKEELDESSHGLHQGLQKVQEATAVLPDYALPDDEQGKSAGLAGILGSLLTLVMVWGLGQLFRRRVK